MYAKPRSFWFRNRKLRGLCFLFRAWLCLRANQTRLSLWERCRAATERAGSFFEGAGLPPCGKTEGATSYLSRIRQTLAQTCPCAAPSVTACAVPPSSERKALFTHRPNSVLPRGEPRSRCNCATFLREEGTNSYPLLFAGFGRFSPLGRLRLRRGRREVFSFSSVDFSTVFCSAPMSTVFF